MLALTLHQVIGISLRLFILRRPRRDRHNKEAIQVGFLILPNCD